MKVVLQQLTKRFHNRNKKTGGDVIAVHDFTFEIPDGKLIGLLGPSGCGKSTALNLISGLLEPSEGQIFFGEDDVTHLPPENRGVGLVFQNYALYPHLTVRQNIMFPLENLRGAEKLTKAEMAERTLEAAKLVQLEGLMDRKPSELSGGQQQRVAIARALVNRPKVLLLDEPLGALDLKLRKEMQIELKRIQQALEITFIYVTHDQEEALTMSDTIVVMNQGYIQQIGTPENIYNEPENAFVADFIGHSNIIDGTMIKDELVEILGARWACVDKGFGNNKPVDVVIRPEDVELVDPSEGTLQGEVTSLIFKGVHYELDVMAGGYEWLVHTTRFVPVGTKVGIKVIPFNIQIMHKPESSDEKAVEIDA